MDLWIRLFFWHVSPLSCNSFPSTRHQGLTLGPKFAQSLPALPKLRQLAFGPGTTEVIGGIPSTIESLTLAA